MSKRPADMTDIAPDDMARKTAQNAAPMRRRMRHISLVVVSILAVLVAGLQHFVLTLPKPLSTQPEYTDGIVVMTGGQQRLTDGIQLLSDGFASKLLISGVGKGVDRDILVRELSSYLAGEKSAKEALDTAAVDMSKLLGDCAPLKYPVQ